MVKTCNYSPPKFQRESESLQLKEGDCLDQGFRSTLSGVGHIHCLVNGTDNLLQCWNKLPKRDKEDFVTKYGQLAAILEIPVQKPAIKALIHFWDPAYRCFSFGTSDMVPTLEEYQQLLEMPQYLYTVYFHQQYDEVVQKIAKHMKVSRTMGRVKSSTGGWHWNVWETLFNQKIRDPNGGPERISILALGIFGLVLFPSTAGQISCEAANAFMEVERKGVNPVAAVLAETILSLNYCRTKGRGTMKCCVHLLYLWMVSHMITGMSVFRGTWWKDQQPLKEFVETQWRTHNESKWIELFHRLSVTQFSWRAIWMKTRPCLVYCGQRPWVPLIGVTGYVSYAPSMVLRQLGLRQCVPRTIGLAQFSGSFADTERYQMLEYIRQDWDSQAFVEQTVAERAPTNTDMYVFWRQAKVTNCFPPVINAEMASDHSVMDINVQEMAEHSKAEDAKGKRKRLEANAVVQLEDEEVMQKLMEQLKLENQELKMMLKAEKEAKVQAETEAGCPKNDAIHWEELYARTQTELAIKKTYEEERDIYISNLKVMMGSLRDELDASKESNVELEEAHRYALKEQVRMTEYWQQAQENEAVLRSRIEKVHQQQQRQSEYWMNVNNNLMLANEDNREALHRLRNQAELASQEAETLREFARNIADGVSGYGPEAYEIYLQRCDAFLSEIARHGSIFGV